MHTVRLFGRFEAHQDDEPIAGLEARKVQELLAMLLLSRNFTVSRETMSDRLWPECDTQRGRKYLRQTLWQLQRCDASLTGVLNADKDWIWLTPNDSIWIDVVQFEQAYASVAPRAKSATGLTTDCRRGLELAVQLYRGELLAGWYHDWFCEPRERIRVMYLGMLGHLMEDAELTGDWHSGMTYGRLVLQDDPANEKAHLHLMRFHCMSGNRTAALRQFEECESALRDAFEIEPSEATRRLVHTLHSATSGAVVVAMPRSDVAPHADPTLQRLAHLHEAMQHLQNEVADCIRDYSGVTEGDCTQVG